MTQYGFYSAKIARKHGYSIYKTPNGKEVNITGISSDPEGSVYQWDDKIKVGIVVSYVRDINPLSSIDSAINELKFYDENF